MSSAVGVRAADAAGAPAASPAGWRGDGSGHYPETAPPLTWSKAADGKTRNILWQRRMPSYSWATPIVVGDKLIVRAEPYDLVCLDKNTGKVLWHRAHGPWEVVAEEDRKTPSWPQVAEAVRQLEEVNNAVYRAADPPKEQVERKNQLQKDLKETVGKIGRKYRMPPELWRGKWSGYTGSTPCTDGRLIWFTSCMGVAGCYDLDGNVKWLASEPVSSAQMGEHGGGSSPALVRDLMIYCLNGTVVAVDRATGKPIWRREYHGGDEAPSIVPLRAAGRTYVIGKKHFMDAIGRGYQPGGGSCGWRNRCPASFYSR